MKEANKQMNGLLKSTDPKLTKLADFDSLIKPNIAKSSTLKESKKLNEDENMKEISLLMKKILDE